jgi:hypothetical protein
MKSATTTIVRPVKYTIMPINIEFECSRSDIWLVAADVINKWIGDNLEEIKNDPAPEYMKVYDAGQNYVIAIPLDEPSITINKRG